MRFKVLQLSLLFALFLLFTTSFSALACEPNDENPSRCDLLRHPKVRSTPAPTVVAKPPAVLAAPVPVVVNGGGTSPGDALEPTDDWRTVDPGGNIWYRLGKGINRQHLDVWLDANGKDGIGFAVYSPEQMNGWSASTPPKGRGTSNKVDTRHDLWWVGQAPAGGIWYVLVTNKSAAPISYKVGYNQIQAAQRDCSGPYWEYLPNGDYILWPGLCK
jgi:hypothetical protein